MKDRKMVNLFLLKYKLVLIIVWWINIWREDEYIKVKSVDIFVM